MLSSSVLSSKPRSFTKPIPDTNPPSILPNPHRLWQPQSSLRTKCPSQTLLSTSNVHPPLAPISPIVLSHTLPLLNSASLLPKAGPHYLLSPQSQASYLYNTSVVNNSQLTWHLLNTGCNLFSSFCGEANLGIYTSMLISQLCKRIAVNPALCQNLILSVTKQKVTSSVKHEFLILEVRLYDGRLILLRLDCAEDLGRPVGSSGSLFGVYRPNNTVS